MSAGSVVADAFVDWRIPERAVEEPLLVRELRMLWNLRFVAYMAL
jgi:hypothetical protein